MIARGPDDPAATAAARPRWRAGLRARRARRAGRAGRGRHGAASTCAPSPGTDHPARRARRVPVWGYSDTERARVTAPGRPDAAWSTEGDTVHDHPAQPARRSATALLFQGQPMPPDLDRRRRRRRPRPTPSPPTTPAPTSTRPGLSPNTQHQAAMGLYGALVVRPATAGPGLRRRVDGVRRRGRPGAQRDRPGAQQRRRPGDLRHAQVHAAVLPRQRPGPPRHRPDRDRRAAARCCCATSTPACIYHSMGVLGAGQTRRSPSTAARSPTPATTPPRRSAPARPPTPSWSRPRPAQTRPAARPCTTPACCCTTATPAGPAACSPSIDVPGDGRTTDDHRSGDAARWPTTAPT